MAAEPRLTLYQYPMSYYTHKVLLALYEKKIDFKSVYINLITNESLEEWYCKLNPAGMVPLLQDGDTTVPESDDIIDYLEKIQPEPCLVPPADTDLGKDVARWRSQLTTEVPIEPITYGIIYNPEVSSTGLKSPVSLSKQDMDNRMTSGEQKLKEFVAKNPDLKNIVDRKLAAMAERKTVMLSPELLRAKIDGLQSVFDKVENALKQTAEGKWLCGDQYSAADITLTVLINRLVMLGLDTLFLTDKRPLVTKFWENVQQRRNMTEMKDFLKKSFEEYMAKQQK